MKKSPMKFDTADWRSDTQLRVCSLAARGLWMEMLCLMHEATPYGHLLVKDKSPTDAQLAMQACTPTEQIPILLGELESAGVFSRSSKGVIFSRRLVQSDKRKKILQKNGKKGGNPNLVKSKLVEPLVIQEVNQPLNQAFNFPSSPFSPPLLSPIPPNNTPYNPPSPDILTPAREKLNSLVLKEIGLPDWVPKTEWDDFLEMRKRMRKPATEKAKVLLIKELEKLQDRGFDPLAVIDQSIVNNYLDFYPLKDKKNDGNSFEKSGKFPGANQRETADDKLRHRINATSGMLDDLLGKNISHDS